MSNTITAAEYAAQRAPVQYLQVPAPVQDHAGFRATVITLLSICTVSLVILAYVTLRVVWAVSDFVAQYQAMISGYGVS